MNKIEHITKQQKVLDAFYKEYFKKTNIHFGYWMAAGFLLGITGILILIPYQEISSDGVAPLAMVAFAQMMGIVCYLSPYRTILNEGMVANLYSRVQYLPISMELLGRYRFQKAVKFQGKLYVALQLGQLFFSIVIYHEVVWGNILYPFLVCVLSPFFCAVVDRVCDNK